MLLSTFKRNTWSPHAIEHGRKKLRQQVLDRGVSGERVTTQDCTLSQATSKKEAPLTQAHQHRDDFANIATCPAGVCALLHPCHTRDGALNLDYLLPSSVVSGYAKRIVPASSQCIANSLNDGIPFLHPQTCLLLTRDVSCVVVSLSRAYHSLNRPHPKLAEKERREGTEKVYDHRMDMIMEVSERMRFVCLGSRGLFFSVLGP